MKHIRSLLQNSILFNEIIKKLQQLDQIKSVLFSFLPKDIAENCVVANIRNDVLVIVTNNPIWKYQLNFLKIDLLEKLRKSSPLLAGISSISITIDYLQENLQHYCNVNLEIKKFKNFSISKNNAVLVNQIIEQEIIQPQLKLRFKKLIAKLQE